jgi:cytochrome c oxidase assembly protein subunit 15
MVSVATIASSEAAESRVQLVARFAWITLVYNIAVILWGAYVRVTGSGAGCGNHWPLCNGDVVPQNPQMQTLVEFAHRSTSGLALVMVFTLLVWCLRKTVKGDWPRYSAVLVSVLLLNEALLGAALVLFDHVGQDQSTARAVFLSLHFGNTLLLLATLALTAQWLSNGDLRLRLAAKPWQMVVIAVSLLAVVCVGVTGALAALGDTLFPAVSLRSSLAQDFSASSHGLLRLRLLHPVAAVASALYILWIFVTSPMKQVRSRRKLVFLVATLFTQLGLGVLNVILLAPPWLQIVHLLVAELFWIALVLVSADLLLKRRETGSARVNRS